MGVAAAAGIAAAGTITAAGINAANQPGGNAPGIETNARKLYRTRRQFQQGWQTMDAQQALWNAALQDRLSQNSLFGNAAQSYSMPFMGADGKMHTRSFDIEGSEGSLAMAARAQPYLQQMRRGDQMDQAGLTTDIYSQFAPGIFETGRNYDPQQAAMSDLLMSQATEGLGAGNEWDNRRVEQGIRGGLAHMGRGHGNADLYTEAIGLDRSLQDRRLKQQDFASRVLGQRSQMYNPAQAQTLLFGRGGGATNELGLVNNAYGSNAQGPSTLLSSVAQNGGQQQQAWALNQSVHNQNANSLASALGGLGNAAMSVYNTPNPYYGMSPGDVPYNYGGMPDSAYRYR